MFVCNWTGHYSPIVKQLRGKAKPDGMVLVVGGCATGKALWSSSLKSSGSRLVQHEQQGNPVHCQEFTQGSVPHDAHTVGAPLYLHASNAWSSLRSKLYHEVTHGLAAVPARCFQSYMFYAAMYSSDSSCTFLLVGSCRSFRSVYAHTLLLQVSPPRTTHQQICCTPSLMQQRTCR